MRLTFPWSEAQDESPDANGSMDNGGSEVVTINYITTWLPANQ